VRVRTVDDIEVDTLQKSRARDRQCHCSFTLICRDIKQAIQYSAI